VLSEPASTGTLLELCNTSLDLLRRLSAQPAGQALVPAGPRGETPLAVADSAAACRSALEASAMYAATQLALWAAKPADGERDDPGDMDADESEADRSLNLSTTSAPDARRSMLAAVPYGSPERTRGGALQASAPAAADRLRRGMTGELATDLLRVLAAARPVLQKHDPRGDSVEITKVLTDFVQDHVVRAR
jgi:nuclear pore complex protein Nup188